MNKATLIGRIGKDPETKTVGSNTVTTFSLATSEKWTNKDTGEAKEETQWHKCQAWGVIGEVIAKHHKKGDRIAVEGKIVYQTYEKDGEKRYVTRINIKGFDFVKDQAGTPNPSPKPEPVPTPQMGAEDLDDIPF